MKDYRRFYLAMLSGVFLMSGFMYGHEFGFMSLKFIMSSIFSVLIYLLSVLWAEQDVKFAKGEKTE